MVGAATKIGGLIGAGVVLTAIASWPSDKVSEHEAVTVGDFVYVTGVVGSGPTGDLASGIDAQTRAMLDNVRAALRQEGLDLSDVVKSNVVLADTRHFAAMNDVYRTYFPNNPPTRATVQSEIVDRDALVQISVVAVKRHVIKRVVTPQIQTPSLPYSWGIQAGNTLFIAGATSRNPETYEPVPGDIATQTRRVLENVGLILSAANMSHADVVECKVFLADARDFGGMNQVYRSFFPDASPPARATVRAGLMNPVFSVEIQCVAVQASDRRVAVEEGARANPTLSPGIIVGDDLYLSGMLGRGPSGYADLADQTARTLDNLSNTLGVGGMTFANVREATIWVTDIRNAAGALAVYDSVMGANRPPTTVVGAGLMTTAGLIEIQMTAGR